MKHKNDPENVMLGAVAKFLKEKGWYVVVIGGARVEKRDGDAEFNYEFVVRFTGGRAKEPAADAKPAKVGAE